MSLNLHKRSDGQPLTHEDVDENWSQIEAALIGRVTPQMFGAVGNGIADDTQAIRDAHATGLPVWYPAGQYALTLSGTPIELLASVDGDNAEIIAVGDGSGDNRVFAITNSTRKIVIGKGITIDGNYDGVGTAGEQDHLVFIRGSENVEVYATLKNAYGDNIYIGSYNDDTESRNIIVDAVLENPRRCNVAVVCCDGAILKGRYSKTIDYVSSIDMEPNTGAVFDFVRNIKIDLEEIDAPVGIIATANNGINNIGCSVRIGRARCKYLFDIGTTALMKDMVIDGVGEFRAWDSTRGKFGQFHTVDGLTIRDVRDIGGCTNDSFNRWDFTNCTRLHIDDVYVDGGGIRQGPRITGCSDVLLGPGCRFVDLDDGGSTTATGGIELSNVTRLTTYANIECDSPCYLIKTGGLFTSRFLGGVLNSAISGIRNDQASSTYEIGLGVIFAGAMATAEHNSATGTVFIRHRPNKISADKGDAAATLLAGRDERTQIWNTPLTADRAVTLSTNAPANGSEFHIIRTFLATGAFQLNVGTGPLIALGPGDWCKVAINGSAWILTEFGTLSGDDIITVLAGGNLASALALSPNINLGSGLITTSATLVYPTSTPYGGGKMLGKGGELSTAFAARADESRSQVAWSGVDGGTLMELDGQLGLLFEQISFLGKPSSGATDRAGIGHHWKMSGGFGSGESTYLMCTFQHFDTAIKFGVSQGDGTCAGMHFIKCTAQNVDVFMNVENDQGLNYILDHCSFNSVDRVIYCERGGNIDMRNGNLATCGATNWCIELAALAGNLWCNTFRNVRIEQNTKRFLKMVGSAEVVIDGFTEAQADQNVTMFDQTGGKLTVKNGYFVTHDSTNPTFKITNHGGGSPGVLTFENCHFATETFILTEWVNRVTQTAPAIVTFKGCTYGANFKALPDFCTSLEWGTVTTMGQTVGATQVIPTIMAISRNHTTVCKLAVDFAQTIETQILATDGSGVVQYAGRRLTTVINDSGTSTLIDDQVIGTDYNPLAIGTPPAVSVSDGFDCIEVTCTGKSANTLNWTVSHRSVARNQIAA